MAESSKSSASLPAQKHEQSLKPPDNMSCPPCAQSQPQELSSLSSGPEKKPSVSWGTPMSTGRGRARGRGLSLIVSAPGMDAALNTSPENQKKLGGLGDFLSRPPASNTQTQVSEKPMGTYADYVELASGAEPHDIPRTAEGQTTTHNQLLSQLDNSSSPSFVTESLTTSVSTQHSHNEPNIPTQLLSPTSMAADVSLSPSAPDIKHPSSDSEPGTVLLFSSLPASWSASKLEGFCESLGEVVTVISVNMEEEGRARVVLSGLTSEEISLAITKPHKFSIALDAVATQSNITTEVSSSVGTIFSTGELSSSYPESSAKASVTVTDKVSFSPSFSSDNLCVPSAQTDTVTSQLPNLMHQDEQLLLQETTHSIFFSSLPSEVNKGELEIVCGMLGENIKIKSLDILGGGKGRAIVSGLTSEEISIVEKKKICKMKGSVINMKFGSTSKVDSPSSQVAVLVVKNLPDNCQPEMLEMYFENPKSGGIPGCVEDIKIIGGKVANVKFHTPEGAASVFAKGGHNFLGKSLQLEHLQSHEKVQEYELDKLFLQMIPVTASDELLQYYLSHQLKIEIDEFDVRRLSNKAVVTFRKTFSIKEFEEVIAKIHCKPLKGATIKAELYKTCTSIRLSNVTESSQYTEEFIQYYFTSKKSGGELKKKVDNVELLGDGMAVVHFENPEDVQAVFSHSHSSTFGQDVMLELNDQLCIAKHQMHNSLMDVNESKGLDIDDRFKLKLKPIVVLSLSNDRSILDQCSEELRVTVDIDTKKGYITATPTLQTPANWQTRWEKQAKNFVKEKIAVHENIQIPRECLTDLLVEFSNIRVESRSFVHRFGDNNASVSIAGEKGIVDYAKKKIQELVEQYTVATTTIPLDRQDFAFIAQVKLTTIKANYPQLQFNLQAKTSSLIVKGTIRSTQEFSQAFDELKYNVKVPIPVCDHICTYLQKAGYQKLHSFASRYSLAIHYVPEKLAVFFLCELNSRELADTAVQKLCELTATFKCRLPNSFVSLQDSLVGFDQLCKELENQNTVNIIITQMELMIVGFQDGVQQCKTNLLEYIKEKCTIEVPVPIEVGIWRLLKKYMIGKWKNITDKCSQLEVVCKEPLTDEEECVIILKGDRFYVDQVCTELSALQSSICRRNVEKNQPGTCAYFRSEKTRKILNGIEAENMVIIEVTEADEEETGLLVHSPSQQKFDKKCTAFLPNSKGGKKLIVYVGDITEFDKADVIVNAANEDLKHIGGLALAIAEKGGPVIQTDSNSYVKRRGKVDTGNVWLTENVGRLSYEAIVHAVGPRWSGGSAKEEALLRKVCLQSLQSSHHKFCSISFPAISSGVYGFPLDKCAQTMVKAFIDYSKQHATSMLQDIYLFLFKQSDSNVFISALKSQLPSSSVHIEQPHVAEPLQPQLGFTPQSRPASKGRRKKAASSSTLPIKLHKGGLLDVKADAYVNSTNPKLDLTQGAVARALYKAGGKRLQAECTTKAPLQVGEVAVTGPGKIACQYIVHTVVPNFDGVGGRAQKVLRKSIWSCLEECSKVNVTSVAFPAIGTGNLGFPNDLAAKIMVEEVLQYLASNPQSSINTVHMVIFMQDTYQAFQMELQATRSQATNLSPEPIQLPLQNPSLKHHAPRRVKYSSTPLTSENESSTQTIGNVNVNIIRGDIGEENTDVIVVPTNTTMKLAGQGVAGAILKKGGQELQMVCDSMVANGIKVTEGKVVTTPVTGALKAKVLFHIVFESKDDKKFTKVISACLQEAERNSYVSISFPAIGTGVYGYPPQVAALGMFRAIEQNALKLKHVNLIRIVLFPVDVYTTFIQVFRNPAGYETPGFFDRAKNFIGSVLPASPWSSTPEVATPTEVHTEDDAVVIRLYGETEKLVSDAEMEIEKLIADTFITKEVENEMINKLSEDEVYRLQKQARDLHVRIEIDRDPLNNIKIKGDEMNVHKMQCFAVELLSEVERNEKRKQEAETLHKTIRWSRMDSNGDEEEYNVEENYEIENAYRYRRGQGSYHCKNLIDGTDFTINFDQCEEIDHNKNDTKCGVKRTDLLKKIQEEVPKDWAKMPINSTTGKEELVHMVTLNKQCREYSEVKRMFDTTMRQQQPNHPTLQQHKIMSSALGAYSTNHDLYNSIIKIERIQNPTLYAQYIARKKEMDKQNPQGHQNERRLFHGTKPNTCPQINHGGFNRSYCGQNATVYGKGVYFARDAEYSARDTYSPRDGNGYKYIYLARVLTGEFTRGSGGMLVPPPKDPSNTHHTYDSVVDNVATPGIFVVFQDAQNYPEYLITFQ